MSTDHNIEHREKITNRCPPMSFFNSYPNSVHIILILIIKITLFERSRTKMIFIMVNCATPALWLLSGAGADRQYE